MAGNEAEVIVIGAGIAGLAAARSIAEAGRRVIVVEARDRVGGRILTTKLGRVDAVELGAEFVHGEPPELCSLLQEARAQRVELQGSQLCWRNGSLSVCSALLEHEFQWIEALKDWQGDDCSFADYLNRVSVPEATRLRLVDYVEGFNAADHRAIGVRCLGKQQSAEDAIKGHRIYRISGGYRQIPEFLAEALKRAGGRVLLGASVTAVDWRRGAIEIEFERNGQRSRLRGSKGIVTLPLGVLLTEGVHFRPRPERVFEAAARLRMGTVQRTVLEFRIPFWINGADGLVEPLSKLSFLYSTGNAPSVWWTPFPEEHSRLTAWTGGPRANSLPQSRGELERHLLSELARIFKRDAADIRKQFVGSFTHDWQHDPFSLGAYSYVTVNGENASETMTEPHDQTLYFAGEHTDITGHWGTVHGALRSGLRAACQVLDA